MWSRSWKRNFHESDNKCNSLTIAEWKLANLATAKSIFAIARHGGPRCCKQNTYLPLMEAVDFLKENLGVILDVKKGFEYEFYGLNKECLRQKCPFHP